MKNYIITGIFLLLFTNLVFPQYFTLAPTGFVSKENLDYTVVEVPGVKQQELYDNVLKSINSLYSNPKEGPDFDSRAGDNFSSLTTKRT
ncbi:MULTISPECIES: hypothetical protein [Sphingobacterium]|uniref:hypothetical protein n=1 Tax=Sphingobacterium TaxID=28453 RepID=UPI00257EA7FE|nr:MULTISPECIES: hypothetical protein [Sphingobacterium]